MANLGYVADDLDTYLANLGSGNPGHALAQALIDRTFRRPARRIANIATHAGIPTYTYQFAWPAPLFGAAHRADLPFAFNHLNASQAPNSSAPTCPSTLPSGCIPPLSASHMAAIRAEAPTPPTSAAPWSSITTHTNAPTVSARPPTTIRSSPDLSPTQMPECHAAPGPSAGLPGCRQSTQTQVGLQTEPDGASHHRQPGGRGGWCSCGGDDAADEWESGTGWATADTHEGSVTASARAWVCRVSFSRESSGLVTDDPVLVDRGNGARYCHRRKASWKSQDNCESLEGEKERAHPDNGCGESTRGPDHVRGQAW